MIKPWQFYKRIRAAIALLLVPNSVPNPPQKEDKRARRPGSDSGPLKQYDVRLFLGQSYTRAMFRVGYGVG